MEHARNLRVGPCKISPDIYANTRTFLQGPPQSISMYNVHGTYSDFCGGLCKIFWVLALISGNFIWTNAELLSIFRENTSVDDPCRDVRGCSLHGRPRMIRVRRSADVPCTEDRRCSVYGGPRMFRVRRSADAPCMNVRGYSVHGRPRKFRAQTSAEVPRTEVRGCSVHGCSAD